MDRKVILIVDDDPDFTARLNEFLTANGYRVLEAANGQEALLVANRMAGVVSLVITDLALPGLNGFELIGNLTRKSTALKVIAITGVYKQPFLDVTTTMGASAALRKPDADKPIPAEWLDTVRRTLGMVSAGSE
jgi:DNA-binding response OmpR family regulator